MTIHHCTPHSRRPTRSCQLFVRDPGVHAAGFDAPNRNAFLTDCLTDLDASLRRRGGRLVVRTGPVGREVDAVAAESGAVQVHMAAGVTGYAGRREKQLYEKLRRRGVALRVHDTVITAVAPGEVTPSGSDHYSVFTPCFRRWSGEHLRDTFPAPRNVPVPEGVSSEPLPSCDALSGISPGLPAGGEKAGRGRFTQWARAEMSRYEEQHDDLGGDATSRLSPYLHFGALSPVELVRRARAHGGPGAEAFVRQLCWGDFHHQVLAARPEASARDYRARLLAASFLAKTLYVAWRIGARHFLDLLVDGDIVNNQLNWQWVAGTGTDTRPHRVLNPVVQGKRFDPRGVYVRRWVPELHDVGDRYVHEPWRLSEDQRALLDYPEPLIDLADGLARFKHARGRG